MKNRKHRNMIVEHGITAGSESPLKWTVRKTFPRRWHFLWIYTMRRSLLWWAWRKYYSRPMAQQIQSCGGSRILRKVKRNTEAEEILGWPKSLFSFFCNIKDTFFIFPNNFNDLDILSMSAISRYWPLAGRGQGCC